MNLGYGINWRNGKVPDHKWLLVFIFFGPFFCPESVHRWMWFTVASLVFTNVRGCCSNHVRSTVAELDFCYRHSIRSTLYYKYSKHGHFIVFFIKYYAVYGEISAKRSISNLNNLSMTYRDWNMFFVAIKLGLRGAQLLHLWELKWEWIYCFLRKLLLAYAVCT